MLGYDPDDQESLALYTEYTKLVLQPLMLDGPFKFTKRVRARERGVPRPRRAQDRLQAATRRCRTCRRPCACRAISRSSTASSGASRASSPGSAPRRTGGASSSRGSRPALAPDPLKWPVPASSHSPAVRVRAARLRARRRCDRTATRAAPTPSSTARTSTPCGASPARGSPGASAASTSIRRSTRAAASSSTTTRSTRRAWRAMMLERLAAARDLMSDDGAIFVEIDDTELGSLQVRDGRRLRARASASRPSRSCAAPPRGTRPATAVRST